MDVEMQARALASEMNLLVLDGMVLQKRHYGKIKLVLQDEPRILASTWMGNFMEIHADCLRAALDCPKPTEFANAFEARCKSAEKRRGLWASDLKDSSPES